MLIIGMSLRGPTKIRFVLASDKINGLYLIEQVLKPLVKGDIPRLFPGEEAKVVLNSDSASAHTAKPLIPGWYPVA